MVAQSPPGECFIHHSDSADANRIDLLAEQLAAVKGIQQFHMHTRGWSDIAYHYVVFQKDRHHDHPVVVQGRLVHYVPAAQLGHNTGTLAICVYGDFDAEGVKEGTISTLAHLIRIHHSVSVVGGHRDVTPTSCPGQHLYPYIASVASLAGVHRYPH